MALRGERYETIRMIASGGMATVYLGRALGAGGFERLVAIKVMHRHLADEAEFIVMFLDEARLAARIRHPNVVSTLDVQQDEEGIFLVMDYIEGPALNDIVKKLKKEEKKAPLDILLRIFLDTLAGLHAAHELTDGNREPLNLVHRDVSPQNILIGVDGISRITDFGVAHAESRLMTTQDGGGKVKGKLSYMAAEQIRSQPIDRRTDIYSAGVVFWELLAGQRLMKGENQGAIVRQILAGPKQGPSELNPAVSKALDAVCLRAIHVQPEERYATAADFAEAIELAAQSARHPIATQRAVAAFVTELKAHASPVDLPPPSESAPRSWAPASLMQRPAKTIDELMARVEAAEDAAGEPLAASATHRAVSSDSIPIEQRRQPKKGGTGLAVLAVLVLLGGAAGWWYLGRPQLGAMSPSPAAAASGSPVDVSSAATVAPPPEPAPAPAAPSTQAEGAPGSDQAPSSNAAPARGAPGRVRPTKGFPAGRTAPTATVYRPKEL